jgi:hypothetical protein
VGKARSACPRTQWRASQRLIKNNPRPLDAAALTTIIGAAFHGDLAQNARRP